MISTYSDLCQLFYTAMLVIHSNIKSCAESFRSVSRLKVEKTLAQVVLRQQGNRFSAALTNIRNPASFPNKEMRDHDPSRGIA